MKIDDYVIIKDLFYGDNIKNINSVLYDYWKKRIKNEKNKNICGFKNEKNHKLGFSPRGVLIMCRERGSGSGIGSGSGNNIHIGVLACCKSCFKRDKMLELINEKTYIMVTLVDNERLTFAQAFKGITNFSFDKNETIFNNPDVENGVEDTNKNLKIKLSKEYDDFSSYIRYIYSMEKMMERIMLDDSNIIRPVFEYKVYSLTI